MFQKMSSRSVHKSLISAPTAGMTYMQHRFMFSGETESTMMPEPDRQACLAVGGRSGVGGDGVKVQRLIIRLSV
jgi:hypothetical protein